MRPRQRPKELSVHPEIDRVRAIPLFGQLSGDELETVASWLQIREESEGRRLTPEGASGYEFFVIEEGTADVVHGGDVIASLGPGDFFGEMAMMGDGRRAADVVASSPITLFEMFGTHFRELEMHMPRVAAAITATPRSEGRRSEPGRRRGSRTDHP
jgi:CRP-like cAMP-binding protein